MDKYLIRVNLTLQFKLRKLKEALTREHPAIKPSQPENELQVSLDEDIQKEGEKTGLTKSGAIEGELKHLMRWHQESGSKEVF